MVDGIGGSGVGRAAIDAALARMRQVSQQGAAQAEANTDAATGFGELLEKGIASVDTSVRSTEQLHLDVLQGKLDLHEVAAKLKESELGFEFALQVRNKLLDAYREVMRMTV